MISSIERCMLQMFFDQFIFIIWKSYKFKKQILYLEAEFSMCYQHFEPFDDKVKVFICRLHLQLWERKRKNYRIHYVCTFVQNAHHCRRNENKIGSLKNVSLVVNFKLIGEERQKHFVNIRATGNIYGKSRPAVYWMMYKYSNWYFHWNICE